MSWTHADGELIGLAGAVKMSQRAGQLKKSGFFGKGTSNPPTWKGACFRHAHLVGGDLYWGRAKGISEQCTVPTLVSLLQSAQHDVSIWHPKGAGGAG